MIHNYTAQNNLAPDDKALPYITLLKLVFAMLGGNIIYYFLQNAIWEFFKNSGDLYLFYCAAKLIYSGEINQLYNYSYYQEIVKTIGPYQNPPLFAILLSPLTVLPWNKFMLFWLGFNQLLLILAVVLVISELKEYNLWAILSLILLCFMYGPIIANTHYGNSNVIIWVCTISAWWLFRRNHQIACGIVISVGFLIKLSPAVLIGYFLFRRSYRVVLAYLATTCIVTALTWFPLHGFEAYWAWYSEMLPRMNSGSGLGGAPSNQSILSFFIKLSNSGFIHNESINIAANIFRLLLLFW